VANGGFCVDIVAQDYLLGTGDDFQARGKPKRAVVRPIASKQGP